VSKATPPALAVPTTGEEILALLKRAEKGDASTLPAVRQLVKIPKVMDLCGGDLARQTEASLIAKASGDNLALREALHRKLELLRAELAGPIPTPLERLLVERVAVCWLQLHYYDVLLAQHEEKLSLAQGDYHHRRCDRAQRRYLSALKALALVRKLALPVLQVNIAKKQINVTSPVATPDPGAAAMDPE
jgi:hypothetical protein